MTYDATLRLEQKAFNDEAIRYFCDAYRPYRPTIVLLPGGLGSQLQWSEEPYGAASATTFSYDRTWLDLGILIGDGLNLSMTPPYDKGRHIVVADGPVNVWLGLTSFAPYARFAQVLDYWGINVLVMGWDWRRPLDHSVSILRQSLLYDLPHEIQAACGVNIFDQDFTIAGHSFGGLVVKLLLEDNDARLSGVDRALTFGTPFYGYGGQLQRFFAGDPMLNDIYDAETVARIVSTFPAVYSLMFCDHQTFVRDGGALGLTAYPVLDTNTHAPADPYSPQPNANPHLFRYPEFQRANWFSTELLAATASVRARMTRPLPAAHTRRFHNFVGVIHDANGQPASSTVVAQRWGWIDSRTFEAGPSQSPISDVLGPGDDTIAAWSARLASAPSRNIHVLRSIEDHLNMMGHNETLNELRHMILPQEAAEDSTDLELFRDVPPAAPGEAAEAFFRSFGRIARGEAPPEIIVNGRRLSAPDAANLLRRLRPQDAMPLLRSFLGSVVRGPVLPERK